MNECWIVTQGEYNEGGRILGVFQSRPPNDVVLALAPKYGPWDLDDRHGDLWWGGGYFLSLDKHEVKP